MRFLRRCQVDGVVGLCRGMDEFSNLLILGFFVGGATGFLLRLVEECRRFFRTGKEVETFCGVGSRARIAHRVLDDHRRRVVDMRANIAFVGISYASADCVHAYFRKCVNGLEICLRSLRPGCRASANVLRFL